MLLSVLDRLGWQLVNVYGEQLCCCHHLTDSNRWQLVIVGCSHNVVVITWPTQVTMGECVRVWWTIMILFVIDPGESWWLCFGSQWVYDCWMYVCGCVICTVAVCGIVSTACVWWLFVIMYFSWSCFCFLYHWTVWTLLVFSRDNMQLSTWLIVNIISN